MSVKSVFEMVPVMEEPETLEEEIKKEDEEEIDDQMVIIDEDEVMLGDYDGKTETEEDEDDAMETSVERDLAEVIAKEDLYPWFNVVFIAIVVGTVEFIPFLCLGLSINYKFKVLDSILQRSGLLMMTIANVSFSIGCVVTAAIATFFVPCAAGSGVPALIAYLFNGKKTDRNIFSIKLVVVKMIGVVLAIVGGLAVGREGPAIHIGAAIGDLTNRLINKGIRTYTGHKVPFSGVVKSNVVMMGAVCGFSSAFRSPVGGMLYCVEEIATHWDIKSHMSLGGQTFVASAIAAFTTQLIINLTSKKGQISFSSIVIFSEEETNDGEAKAAFQYHDLLGFLIIAILCGLLAGAVTNMDMKMRQLKQKFNPATSSKWVKLTRLVRDAFLLAFFTTMCFCLVPLIYTNCKNEPVSYDDHGDDDHRRLGGGGGDRSYVQYICNEGEYSQLASLSLGGEEGVIRHLLSRDAERFNILSLVIFFIFYIPISMSNRLLPVPMGSFVPNLLIGGLVGRVVGEAAHLIYPDDVLLSEPGVFGLLGAACMLGAWTRTMIAVAVTLIEVSGDIGMISPIIVGIVIARSVATMVADHSYTHEIFYGLVDHDDDDGPPILHPNDWKPQKKLANNEAVRNGSFRRNSAGSVDDVTVPRNEVRLATPQALWSSGANFFSNKKKKKSGKKKGKFLGISSSSFKNIFFHRSNTDASKSSNNEDDNEKGVDSVVAGSVDNTNNPDVSSVPAAATGKKSRRTSVFF